MHKKMLLPLIAMLLVVWGSDAAARHGRGRVRTSVGFYFNDPFRWGGDPYGWGPDPFFYPYRPYIYNPPPLIIEQRQPPVYIQRQLAPAAPAAAASSNWYYCPKPSGYYPYVQSCSQPWVSVDPRSVQSAPAR